MKLMHAGIEKEYIEDHEYDQYSEEHEDDAREMGMQRMSTSTGGFTTSAQQNQKKRKFKLPRIQVPHIK